MTNYVPTRDAELREFAENFSAKITAAPTAYGLVAAQASAFAALSTAFADALRLLNDPVTRSPYYTEAKNNAREALVDGPGGIRALANIVQAHPGITDLQLVDLRLTVRDRQPTPTPPPEQPPVLVVKSTLGRVVTLQLRDFTDSERRGRPMKVAGATILMHVGETAPLDPNMWIFCQNTTKTEVEIDIAPTIAPGAKVWFIAFWRNRRDDAGPACVPVSTRLGDSMAMAA